MKTIKKIFIPFCNILFFAIAVLFYLLFLRSRGCWNNNLICVLFGGFLTISCFISIFVFFSEKKIHIIQQETKADLVILAIILSGGLFLRLYFVLCHEPVVQVSDFSAYATGILKWANGDFCVSKSVGMMIPYALLVNILNTKSQTIILSVINIFIAMGSISLVYIIVKNLFCSPKSGLIASFFVSFYPPMIFYCGVIASEHIWLFYLLAGIRFIQLSQKCSQIQKKILFLFFSGVFFALAQLTRGNSIVFIFAIFTFFLVSFFHFSDRKHIILFLLLAYVCGIILPFAGISIFQKGISKKLTIKDFQIPLLIGSNLQYRGQYNISDFQELTTRYEKKYSKPFNRDKSVPVALEIFLERWKNNTDEEMILYKEKILRICGIYNNRPTSAFAWWCINWTLDKDRENVYKNKPWLANNMEVISVTFHLISILLASMSIICIPLMDFHRRTLLLIGYVSLGGILILAGFHEYQPRYAIIFYLFLMMMSGAVGILCERKFYSLAHIGFSQLFLLFKILWIRFVKNCKLIKSNFFS